MQEERTGTQTQKSWDPVSLSIWWKRHHSRCAIGYLYTVEGEAGLLHIAEQEGRLLHITFSFFFKKEAR